jgi:hypothetical protein
VHRTFRSESRRAQCCLCGPCWQARFPRASQVYAAYAVKHLGVDADEALCQAAAFGGWPLPLEQMTGIRLKVVRANE